MRSKIKWHRQGSLTDLLNQVENYKEYKPIYDQLNAIKFKKRRENFAATHERELTMFYMASRKLKPHFSEKGQLPITQWKQERARLEQEVAAIDAQHSGIWQEVKKLVNIQKCVEDVRRRQERTQEKTRGIDR